MDPRLRLLLVGVLLLVLAVLEPILNSIRHRIRDSDHHDVDSELSSESLQVVL